MKTNIHFDISRSVLLRIRNVSDKSYREYRNIFYVSKAAFNNKRALCTSKIDLELRKKLVKCYIWSIALYVAETWMLWAVDQKHMESFEMRRWKRMEISWTDHVRNEEVLLRVKE
jgi:hypothetical protein